MVNPLARVPLLLRDIQIFDQDLVDEPRMRLKLRSSRLGLSPISRRRRMLQHLRHRPAVDSEAPRRHPLAQPVPKYR
jgi:hypothetical protein